jgi:hypothetical protein
VAQGACEACGGTGFEWTCADCDAEGFVLSVSPEAAALERVGGGSGSGGTSGGEDVLWRTCPSCIGVGKKPCEVCSPPQDEVLTPIRPR